MKVVKSNNRNYNIDLLRITACFMVIVIHVSAYNWYTSSVTSFNWIVYNTYDSIVRSAVPIFVMISGIFFLNDKKQSNIKRIYFKNIFKLIFIYFIFSIIYYLYNIFIRNYSFNLRDCCQSIISGPFHFWYIPTIIGLYVISPILSKITKTCDKKIFKYFFIIFMIGCFIKTITYFSFIPDISYFNLLVSKLPIDIICQFYSYFILGYFLYNFDISDKKKNIIYILGIISIFLCAIFTYIVSKYNSINTTSFYNEFSIFTFFEGIAIFLLFKNKIFISEQIYADKVSTISSCTLGIYIIHVLVMYLLFDFNLIKITDFNTVLSIPIISILVFVICLVLVYFYKKLICISRMHIKKN